MLARSLLHRSKRPVTVEVPAAPEPGVELCDRYRLEEMIARGGTAMVYRATDLVLGETVAVKLLLPDGAMASEDARVSQLGFREEAVSSMRLSHPMILRVFTYDRHPPWEFLVMELVVGETLSHYVKSREVKRLSPIETLEVGLGCLEALDYAHTNGVVHNDIKPGNILYTRAGGIKICDFGLARLIAHRQEKRVVAGTPGYMSPEKLLGEPGDPRSDLFSVAATLYALGNGRLMVPREALILDGWPGPEPSTHLPQAIHEVLCIAAAMDPRDRYQTAHEMREALIDVRQIVLRQYALFAVEHAVPPEPEPLPEPPSEDEFDAIPPTRATVPNALDTVLIPGGTLDSAYGGNVHVPPFRMDRTPVTNAAYADFLRETGASPPAHWLGGQPPSDALDHPVVGVSFEQARRYAEFRGKRLPTNAEWERAARSDGRAFPWGNAWEPMHSQNPENRPEGTAPVDAHSSGVSAEGCLDLIGNVWEWTAPDPRLAQPEDGFAWVLGGSYRHACHAHGAIARSAVDARKYYQYLGFRCALDEEG